MHSSSSWELRTEPATKTAPDQLLLNSAWVELDPASDTGRATAWFGVVKCARPEARRATRCARRSLDVGTANAAVARSTWQSRVAANMRRSELG